MKEKSKLLAKIPREKFYAYSVEPNTITPIIARTTIQSLIIALRLKCLLSRLISCLKKSEIVSTQSYESESLTDLSPTNESQQFER